ncbi:MAG TPA: hypothetical protein DEP42_05085 [Ruminococcaceae bacterium]|nr:hypothetical protein [Oscillospiraceae bacterium]
MGIASSSLLSSQSIFIGIFYLVCLGLLVLGGMRKKETNLRRLFLLSIVLFLFLIKTYNGIHSTPEIVDLLVMVALALGKGLYLGHKKRVEKIGDVYYIWNDLPYVLAWVLFLVGKTAVNIGIQHFTGKAMPTWHTLLYFFLYFTLRSGVIVATHPQAFQMKRRKRRQP